MFFNWCALKITAPGNSDIGNFFDGIYYVTLTQKTPFTTYINIEGISSFLKKGGTLNWITIGLKNTGFSSIWGYFLVRK